MAEETPDLYGAFPRLDEAQIKLLEADGERRLTREGDVLVAVGDKYEEFFVVLSGKVAVVDSDEEVIRVHGPGRFLGELGLLEGQPSVIGSTVIEPGEVLAVPVHKLRSIVLHDPVLGDLILRAFLIRRSLLIGLGAGFRIIGSCFSPDTRRLREFAARNRLPHKWIDVEKDPEAESLLRQFGIGPQDTPVVIWNGKTVLRNPSITELAKLAGLKTTKLSGKVRDLVVVGAGPAGLASAVYAASEGLDTYALDSIATGGQAATSPRIENYLGFPSGISGLELAERAVIQVDKFGARRSVPAEAVALRPDDGDYVVRLADGHEIHCRSVIIATGARYRKLDVRRLEDFENTSVYYAATVLEAQQCRQDPIAIVGGGNSAGQAALFLAGYVPKVYLVVRDDDLSRNMSRYLIDQVTRHPKVKVLRHTEVRELIGDEELVGVVVEDNHTHRRRVLDVRALFVFIGAQPCTGWLADTIALDEDGFVLTGREVQPDPDVWTLVGREPMKLETSRPGVFAAGDVRSGSTKRVSSAVGEGAMAIHLVHEHFESIRKG